MDWLALTTGVTAWLVAAASFIAALLLFRNFRNLRNSTRYLRFLKALIVSAIGCVYTGTVLGWWTGPRALPVFRPLLLLLLASLIAREIIEAPHAPRP